MIDPGEDAATAVAEVVAEYRLKPVAVLLTHGHLDHVANVLPVAGGYDATCWIHPEDRGMLADPYSGLPPSWAEALLGPNAEFAEPDDVRELHDGARLEIAGLTFLVDHAPGHTGGSVMFSSPQIDDRHPEQDGEPTTGTLFAGDVVFAGSIGRTDLPGGDPVAMRRSLTEKVLPLPDTIRILPGHGEPTTIGRERRANPFLRELATPTS